MLEQVKQEWMTVKQYAELKGCHPGTIRQAGHDGRIEMEKIGTTLLVRAPEFSVINDEWEPQEGSPARKDGRYRYIVYLTDDELSDFRVDYGDQNEFGERMWRDPRAARAAREEKDAEND